MDAVNDSAALLLRKAGWAKLLLGALFAGAWLLFLTDFCAPLAGSLMLVGTGLYLGVLLTQVPTRAFVAATALVLLVAPVAILCRKAPVYTLAGGAIDRVEVSRLNRPLFKITDPAELQEFQRYLGRGSYESMLKSGFGYHVVLWQGSVGRGYYVHGNALGRDPGGAAQSVFVPTRRGGGDFMAWFEAMLIRHGHPPRWREASQTGPATQGAPPTDRVTSRP
jgi:hypothetical protein